MCTLWLTDVQSTVYPTFAKRQSGFFFLQSFGDSIKSFVIVVTLINCNGKCSLEEKFKEKSMNHIYFSEVEGISVLSGMAASDASPLISLHWGVSVIMASRISLPAAFLSHHNRGERWFLQRNKSAFMVEIWQFLWRLMSNIPSSCLFVVLFAEMHIFQFLARIFSLNSSFEWVLKVFLICCL